MSQTASQQEGEIVRDFLSIADLLEQPQLARIYAYLYREGETTVSPVPFRVDKDTERARCGRGHEQAM